MSRIEADDGEIMTISQMCAAFDVTPRTLRFYESKGLIAPRREGQRRFYGARERGRLALILRGKRFGFSLKVMHELLDLYDPETGQVKQLTATISVARERLRDMRAQRDELDQAITELEDQIALVSGMLREQKDG